MTFKWRENGSDIRKIDVLFLVEHVVRELDAVTCLVHKLRDQFSIEAEVKCYYHDFDRTLTRYWPSVVVFPFFYGADHSYPIEYLAKWPQAKFVNLSWEQILMKIDHGMKTPRDVAARERVLHICWTQKHCDFLSGEGVKPDHLQLTGSPVMKLYDLPYRRYFVSRSDLARRHSIDPGRKWVLFPESYQWAFLYDGFLQGLIENQNADSMLVADAKNYSERCLSHLFAWLGDLRAETDPLFILRPHPTARGRAIDFMQQGIGASPENVAIIKAGSVREWILAADHVISSHSTTLIEAAVAGKPVHLFSPEPLPDALTAEWHDLIPTLRNRESFLQVVRQFPIEPTGARLAFWARAQQCPEGAPQGDPLDDIAKKIAQLRRAEPYEASSLPDHRRLWNGQVLVDVLCKSRRRSDWASEEDDFRAHDVARRVWRWRRILQDSPCA